MSWVRVAFVAIVALGGTAVLAAWIYETIRPKN